VNHREHCDEPDVRWNATRQTSGDFYISGWCRTCGATSGHIADRADLGDLDDDQRRRNVQRVTDGGDLEQWVNDAFLDSLALVEALLRKDGVAEAVILTGTGGDVRRLQLLATGCALIAVAAGITEERIAQLRNEPDDDTEPPPRS
jgi:hypothetical protein